MSDIEARIARLEAESAIRGLKARYFNACDAKDVDRVRACFLPDAELDYPPIGTFGPDGLIDIFTKMAVGTPIVDCHQIHNGEIEIIDADNATAHWSLGFSTWDPRAGSFRLIASTYDDHYARTADGWRIAKSRHRPRMIFDGKIVEGRVEAGPLLP